MKQDFLVWSFPTLLMFIRGTPVEIRTIAFLAFVLTASDMCLGVFAALVCKEFRSGKMRNKWVLKSLGYFGMVILGNAATIVTGYWLPATMTYWAILVIEVGSLLEKLVKIQVYGGLELGPLSKFVSLISPYFDISGVAGLEPGTTIVRHAAVMSNNPLEPEIHITETETATMQRKPAVASPPRKDSDK